MYTSRVVFVQFKSGATQFREMELESMVGSPADRRTKSIHGPQRVAPILFSVISYQRHVSINALISSFNKASCFPYLSESLKPLVTANFVQPTLFYHYFCKFRASTPK